MNAHSLETLEFGKVLAELSEYCFSQDGQNAARVEEFFEQQEELEVFFADVGRLTAAFESEGGAPMFSIPSIASVHEVIEKPGRVLDLELFGALLRYLEGSEGLVGFCSSHGISKPQLASDPSALFRFRRRLGSYVDTTGTLREKDIPELAAIRRRVMRLEEDQRRRADRYLKGSGAAAGYFASDRPTVKEGRTVLPLVADHRGKVEGIMVDMSSSGSTVYIEPPDILAANNAITAERRAYDIEVQRILRKLTEETAAHRNTLRDLSAWSRDLDRLWCRARYALVHSCSIPTITKDELALNKARHPLLPPPVVANDIALPEGVGVVIITGPNTGGKTVTLKTLGLVALMTLCGIPVPVGSDSKIPLYDQVFADIGDEQSIEQSLSTFSGHLRRIGEMLAAAGPRSLVLLDEPAAGTDPTEGSALAMSILDELRRRGTDALVSSHHGALKHYGYTHPDVDNASVEFDVETLAPTYRLLLGSPGSSHAVTIAARMGLPPDVIAAAEQYLESGQSDSAKLIEELTREHAALRDERSELARRLAEVAERESHLDEERADLERREKQVKQGRLDEFDRFLAERRKQVERAVEALATSARRGSRAGQAGQAGDGGGRPDDGGAKPHGNGDATEGEWPGGGGYEEEARNKLAAAREFADTERRGTRRSAGPGDLSATIAPGAEVRIVGGTQTGVVEAKGRGNTWVIRAGAIKMTLPEEKLELVRAPGGDGFRAPGGGAGQGPAGEAGPWVDIEVTGGGNEARLELDIRGLRVYEALDALERQVDAALAKGMGRFSVIHGTGGGALQQAVKGYLRDRGEVKGSSFARPEEGGFGKTIVELKVN